MSHDSDPRFASQSRCDNFARSPRLLPRVVGAGDVPYALNLSDESDPGEWLMSRPSRLARPPRRAGLRGRDLIGLGGFLAAAVVVLHVLGIVLDRAADTTSGLHHGRRRARHGRRRGRLLGARPRGPRVGRCDDRPRAQPTLDGPRRAAREAPRSSPSCVTSARRSSSPWSSLSRRSGSPASSASGAWPPRSRSASASGCSTTWSPSTGCFASSPTASSPPGRRMVRSTLVRLLVLTVVAVGLAVVWWPDGIGLLLGLAVFRLIALVMTTLPLLKELKRRAEVAMTALLVPGLLPFAADGGEEGSTIEIGHHSTWEWNGLTFHSDTIIATFVAGALVLLLGLPDPPAADQGHRGPRPDQAPADLGGGRRPGQHARSRTTSARSTPTSHRWRSRCSSSSCSQLARAPAAEAQRGHPHPPAPTADTNLTYALAASPSSASGSTASSRRV